ncbi:division/cell wall cluster transcriptional repressor MraZ [PVC group bacterium (ex Bugula neritina AB1)]|nr:division/cell wall cluster transcriptional repressor MraZ [PVC group bacterium (ex Bugula neritina AB1)]
MFFGEYEHSLDSKNRLTLPSCFREHFEDKQPIKFFMTRGFDQCLALYPSDSWKSELEKLKHNSYFESDVRKFHRLLYSKTSPVTCDRQGRILITDKFKKEAKITKDVTLVGLDNKIEIWDPTLWEKFNEMHHDSFEKIAESLGVTNENLK